MHSILIVDRGTLPKQSVRRILQQSAGIESIFVETTEEALEKLSSSRPDAVLLNPSSTDLDGPQLVRTIRERYAHVPVVLITTKGSEAVAIRAFANGAVNYVPRHLVEQELGGTIRSVLQAAQQKRRELQLLERLTDLRCRFELENDRSLIPLVVSYLQEHLTRFGLCDESLVIRAGIAIDEALVNALCHGNLELDTELRESDCHLYEQQATERALLAPYCHRRIRVEAHISKYRAELTIEDDGPGFDPESLPDPTDSANMDKVSGRGVHLMRSFMDEVSYNERGNRVKLVLFNRCSNGAEPTSQE